MTTMENRFGSEQQQPSQTRRNDYEDARRTDCRGSSEMRSELQFMFIVREWPGRRIMTR